MSSSISIDIIHDPLDMQGSSRSVRKLAMKHQKGNIRTCKMYPVKTAGEHEAGRFATFVLAKLEMSDKFNNTSLAFRQDFSLIIAYESELN